MALEFGRALAYSDTSHGYSWNRPDSKFSGQFVKSLGDFKCFFLRNFQHNHSKLLAANLHTISDDLIKYFRVFATAHKAVVPAECPN